MPKRIPLSAFRPAFVIPIPSLRSV
jgi:hypothetical protein